MLSCYILITYKVKIQNRFHTCFVFKLETQFFSSKSDCYNSYFSSLTLLAVIDGLVPGPALCPGAGAAERPQEIL